MAPPEGVVSIDSEAALGRGLSAAGPGEVVCVLFTADWAAGTFGLSDLATLASASNGGIRCLSVDLDTDAGQDVALDVGVGQKLPVLRFHTGASSKHAAELVGEQCSVAAAERVVAQVSTAASENGSVRDAVRAAYGATVAGGASVLPADVGDPKKRRNLLGYAEDEVTESADLGLGCGNPLVKAALQPGEVVVDLGSGAGMDCFIAGKQVGDSGHVVGVDMTPEMLSKARATARKDGVSNVSFRLGEIEHLPVGDGVADCVISNCVINLSPEKPHVYREMNRVLRPGGRVSISDVLRTSEIPDALKTVQGYACWISGASAEAEMTDMLLAAGFSDIRVEVKENAADIIKDWIPGSGAEQYVTSAYVTATKPRDMPGLRDDVRHQTAEVQPEEAFAAPPAAGGTEPAAVGCWG